MKVTIYGKTDCTYCSKAIFLTRLRKIEPEYKTITEDATYQEMMDAIPDELKASVRTVPQIFVDGKYIGGYDDYDKFLSSKVA